VITTSPIKSHPSTQVIDNSIESILKQPSLKDVHIYIICDGAKVKKNNEYKSGIVTMETMKNYNAYKETLRQKYSDVKKYTIIERE
jgi:hypothetical protein